MTKVERMVDYPSPFIFDIQAVLAWSRATGNEAQIVLAAIQDGSAVIYNRVWNEFRAAYPEEAEKISAHEFSRLRVNEEHRMAAAAVAEKANATFGRKGPYDQCIEWCVAGIASCGPCTVVTDLRRKARYEQVDGLSVVTFNEYLELQ